MMSLDLAPSALALILVMFGQLLFIGIPFLVFKWQKKSIKDEWNIRTTPNTKSWRRRIGDLALGVAIGAGFLYVGSYLIQAIRFVTTAFLGEEFFRRAQTGGVSTSPPSMSPVEGIILIVLQFVLVGLCEEFFFRGVVFRELSCKSLGIGLFGSSFIFMLYHVFPGIVPWSTFFIMGPYYFIFGLLLALIVHFQKFDLLTAITAHGTFNALLIALRYFF